jgi:hypothetical protein
MKKIIITFALFCLSFTSLFAQNFSGKRIISGSLSMNLNSVSLDSKNPTPSNPNSTVSTFGLTTTFLTGKIRANDTYTAYGFKLGINNSSNVASQNTSLSSYTIGPVVQFGKFVKVFDQFYYAPNSTFGISGTFGSISPNTYNAKTTGFGASASIAPLNFVYQIKDNLLLSISLGGAGINYTYSGTSSDTGSLTINNLSVYGSVTNFSSLGAYYLF